VFYSNRFNLLELETDNSLVIDKLDQATPVLGGSNVAVLLTDRRRHAAHHFDIDRILRVVLAALTDLELHLAIATASTVDKHFPLTNSR